MATKQEFYVRMKDDGDGVQSVISYEIHEGSEGVEAGVYGACYGYCGGGVNDGGYFFLDADGEDDGGSFLSYDDIDAIEDEERKEVFERNIRRVWELIEDEDDVLSLTEEGQSLKEEADDEEVFMSDGFDGDSLDQLSQKWPLTLRFES